MGTKDSPFRWHLSGDETGSRGGCSARGLGSCEPPGSEPYRNPRPLCTRRTCCWAKEGGRSHCRERRLREGTRPWSRGRKWGLHLFTGTPDPRQCQEREEQSRHPAEPRSSQDKAVPPTEEKRWPPAPGVLAGGLRRAQRRTPPPTLQPV